LNLSITNVSINQKTQNSAEIKIEGLPYKEQLPKLEIKLIIYLDTSQSTKSLTI
jgi:hypothetical protein